MKKIFGLLLLSALFSCEKDLTEENPAPSEKNILLATSFIYGEQGSINPDSVFTNDLGYGFFITDIQLVVTKFFFVQKGDTIITREDPFIVDMKQTDELLVVMPPGGYSGYYGVTLGLDSAASADINPGSLDKDSELQNSDVLRKDNLGIDHVVIKGRLINPLDPLDSTGTLPFEYRLGTEATQKTKTSLMHNFSLMRHSQVKFVMLVDLEPVFNSFDILLFPKITTDPSVPVDFATATDMADSLKIGLF